MRETIPAGPPWGEKVGYSRAVKMGPMICISGTTAGADGATGYPDDMYGQAVLVLQKIEKALVELGARPDQVIRTRIYVTDISQWQEVGRAHAAFFGTHRPATSMVEVSALIGADLLVEIEADAYIL